MRSLFQDREHLMRMAVLFAGGLIFFFAARSLLVPKGFGTYGHYRAKALKEARQIPVKYAGAKACGDCHSDVASSKGEGPHKEVSCETCHGPLAKHTSEPKSLKPTRPDPARICLSCHQQNAAKPPNFPQVDPGDHAGSTPCNECHGPHNPAQDAGPTSVPDSGHKGVVSTSGTVKGGAQK